MKHASKQRQLQIAFLTVLCLGMFLRAQETLANTAPQTRDSAVSLSDEKAPLITMTIGDRTETISEEQISDLLLIDNRIGIDTNYRSEIENIKLCPEQGIFCDFSISQKTRGSIRSRSVLTPNEAAIRDYVDNLSKKVLKEAVDAKFTVTDGKISVFALNQDGSQLDIEKSVDIISDALATPSPDKKRSVELPITIIKPAIRSSDAEKLGIVELIGEGHTNFAGSPKNRIHNFKRALEQFNGVMVAPGEEFSFVDLLGEVDGEHGYLPELVIKHNKTEPEFGGGICQVSSTVFRAAIYSGLKITARRNHAYPVSYYKPYGMDATIYIPKPDFKFLNNTPGHILMQSSIEGTQLTFRFYGTSDGRKTEVDGPHIIESNPDGSMKTIFTQKVTDAQGSTLIKDDFRSNYASPSKYPHPDESPIFSEKPGDWSQAQWSDYKKSRNI